MPILNGTQKLAFAGIAQVILGTDLILIDRQLVPDDIHETQYMPASLKKRLHELLYGGLLFECDPEGGNPATLTIYEVALMCDACMAVLALPENGFLLLGPYIPDKPGTYTLDEMLANEGIPLEQKNTYRTYLNSIPVLSQDKIHAFFVAIGACVCNTPVSGFFKNFNISSEHPAPCPVFEEDTLQLRAEMLERRYAYESTFINMAMNGNADAILRTNFGGFTIDRIPNKLRNEKNLIITLNTLLRKSMEGVHVHPLYIDTISSKWAVCIENMENVGQAKTLCHDMVQDYCREVRRHSLANYTPHVRAMINYIHFNLNDPDLGLKKISEYLKINASYLSQHFNRETLTSLPEYITDKRIAQAKQLLTSNTTLNIGQIATATGFTDVNYFTKVFKKQTGYTPTAYRRQ